MAVPDDAPRSAGGPGRNVIRARRDAIIELVLRHGSCSVEEVATRVGVSQATVRRDLAALERQGSVRRTWGGAEVAVAVRYGEAFTRRAERNEVAKQAIAFRAAELVAPNMVIGLSGGTSCTALARVLRGRPINVVTNAVNIAVEFYAARQTKVIVTGGALKANSYELVGAAADAIIRGYHLDLFLFSASAVDEDGFTRRDHAEAAVVRTFRSVADTCVMLIDSSKVGTRNAAPVAGFDEVDVVMCDDATPRRWVDAYGSGGAEVIVVPTVAGPT